MAAEAGLKPREIDDSTISELMIAVEAKHNETMFQLRNVRTVSYYSVAPYLEKGVTMEKFMPLPGDGEAKGRLKGKELLEERRRQRIQRESLKKINGTARS